MLMRGHSPPSGGYFGERQAKLPSMANLSSRQVALRADLPVSGTDDLLSDMIA
jgi:hypothetical protein